MKGKCVLGITVLLLCGIVHADIWYVHPDSALNTIQAGLDSCAVDDVVMVGPGTYVENIVWPPIHGIDLISEYGPDTTIIDGDSAGQVINIAFSVDTGTVIRGFTIKNGYCDDLFGAGICCDGASPRIVNNVLSANSSYGFYYGGGAIACLNFSSAIIDSNTVVGNYGTWGGGILLFFQCNPAITNNVIDGNAADSVGGGILCYTDCDPFIAGNTITDNSTTWGGGIAVMNNASATIHANVIDGNTAVTMGGGIYCYNDVSVTITNNVVTENTCSSYGAGIRCSPNTSGIIKHCIVSNNYGWGIGISESSLQIDSCAIENNTSFGVRILTNANPTINWCNIAGNQSYGVYNSNTSVTIDAENNWWGDPSGPAGVGPGTGDPVSAHVDYEPWLTDSVQGIGIEEKPNVTIIPTEDHYFVTATVFRGPLILPEGKKCRVFDITGRLVQPASLKPGIYFIQIGNKMVQKVIKVK